MWFEMHSLSLAFMCVFPFLSVSITWLSYWSYRKIDLVLNRPYWQLLVWIWNFIRWCVIIFFTQFETVKVNKVHKKLDMIVDRLRSRRRKFQSIFRVKYITKSTRMNTNFILLTWRGMRKTTYTLISFVLNNISK